MPKYFLSLALDDFLKLKIKMMSNPILLQTYRFFFFHFIIVFFPFSLLGQASIAPKVEHTLFKELERPDLIKLTIETDVKQLINKKYKEEWQAATLKLEDGNGATVIWETKLRARGNVRKRVCFYPPIKVKLKKEWLAQNGMDSNYNDIKLVIGCKKGDFYENLVLKELLVYKLYQELTDYSFRTQLAEIEFIDTGGKRKPFTTYAFFIENEDEMAARLNAVCAKPKRLSSKRFYSEQLDKMVLFEYMIGNTDWSAITSHNVRIIKSQDFPLPLPIAYDFDYSGLVNAPYAIHGEGINLKSVTERLFLGMCREAGTLEKLIPIFNEKQEAFYKIIQEFHHLEEKERTSIINYLDEFYETINSPSQFKRSILDYCRPNGR